MDDFTSREERKSESIKRMQQLGLEAAGCIVTDFVKYEHEGFINISLVRLDEILKKCGVSEDGE